MVLDLLDVNDDCLVEIFENLTIEELAAVASTCTRFQTIARDVFSLHHKSNSVELYVNSIAERRQTSAILRNFGDLIARLEIISSHMKDSTFTLNMMSKYCTGVLEKLKLSNFYHIQQNQIVDAKPLFRNVHHLILYASSGISGSFLSEAKKLNRLELNELYSTNILHIVSNNYPQLRSLILNCSGSQENPNKIFLIDFFERHPTLIELDLCDNNVYDVSWIGECQWLRKLSIRIRDCLKFPILPIAQLVNLTTLKLSTSRNAESVLKILQTTRSAGTLEELVISSVYGLYGRRFMACVGRFIRLKYLSMSVILLPVDEDAYTSSESDEEDEEWMHPMRDYEIRQFVNSVEDDRLVDLVRNLPHLGQLALFSKSEPDLNKHIQLKQSTLLRIREICENRNQKLVFSNYDVSKRMEDNNRLTGEEQLEFFRLDYGKMTKGSSIFFA